MVLLRRMLPRRRRSRVVLLVIAGASLIAGVSWASRTMPVPDPPIESLAKIQERQRAADRAGETAEVPAGETETASQQSGAGKIPEPARVPDVPLAWRRIAEQAAAWPAATQPLAVGETAPLPTVPASRMRDTLGLNIDVWRTEYGYRDFGPVLAKAVELNLRHARVGMQASGTHGLARMQQLGRIGVRLDVTMGDALGRYDSQPYAKLADRLRQTVLPYVDSVEGTNEPDLAKQAGWETAARDHQRKIVATVEARRGRPIGVIAPSLGRIANLAILGDYAGLADAGNAHAYSSAGEPSGAIDQWRAGLEVQLPGGPIVITEAGFQTDLRQTKYHTPLPEQIAAAYTPRILLEAMRRGIPQVYLYEMIDRWNDPFGVDTSAHFGLLTHDLRPKPAWTSLVRLQNALLDGGRPDRDVQPLAARVVRGPADLRMLAFRRRDGSASLALWRAVSQWDELAVTPRRVARSAVQVTVGGELAGALSTDVVSGKRDRLSDGSTIRLRLGGSPVVVTGIR